MDLKKKMLITILVSITIFSEKLKRHILRTWMDNYWMYHKDIIKKNQLNKQLLHVNQTWHIQQLLPIFTVTQENAFNKTGNIMMSLK